MNARQLQDLGARVQHNCHISDARHGGDYQLCTFLLKMREYYRWEKGLPLGGRLPKDELGNWLAAREQLWEQIEHQDYLPVEIGDERLDPFAADVINRRLEADGLVYGAGLGHHAKPHFFLGRLEDQRHPDGCRVLIANREYARDLGAPPAMLQGDTIYLRRESLRRLLWEKLEGWRWSRPDNALGRAFGCYDLVGDLDGALDAMTEMALALALAHEQGEHVAGLGLGEAWWSMLADVAGTPAELLVRAVRDHLADCLVSLPALIDRGEAAAWHLFIGNQTPLSREIFPSLERAYTVWRETGSPRAFAALAERAHHHWRTLAQDLLAVHARLGPAAAGPIAQRVRACPL